MGVSQPQILTAHRDGDGGMKLKRNFDAVAAWGVTVTLAYFLTPAMSFLNISAINIHYQILTMWTLLMAVPIYMSYQEGKGPLGWKTLNPIWAAFMIIGLVGNFAGQLFLTGESLIFSYFHKWFLLPGVLFIYTSYKMSDLSRKIYGAAAVLNIMAVLLLAVEPVFQIYAFPTAAVIQGMPMIADWYVRKK